MKNQLAKKVVKNILLFKTLKDVLAILQSIETPAILLKGAAFLLSIYDSNDDFREMGDIDLLIHEEEVPKVVQALERHGYLIILEQPFKKKSALSFSSELTAKHPEHGTRVEIHWQLVNIWWLRGVIPLDYPAIWQRARPFTAEGCPTLILSAEDTLLHACSHLAFHHRFEGDKWYKDIHLLIEKETIDWDLFVQTARQSRLKTAAYCTLNLASQKAALSIPDAVLAKLKPSPLKLRLIQIIMNMLPAEDAPPSLQRTLKQFLLELILMDRWGDKITVLLRFLYCMFLYNIG
ncbi:MAG: nucleotidyltransferase family protein [Anaerolineales bacterium]|nr:nucleotidyltransferase family protein [Anaerolineales bacterium]